MHVSRSLLVALALCGAVASLTLAGCAEERAPIDRVQPNALEKSMFTGQWYYQRTVVDVPSGSGFTFVGSTDFSGLKRITFDIQEDTLLVRRYTELVEGADDRAVTGEDYEGEVIAAFRIESHFDITRQYNSTTGEELNILFENTSDRPWYEREYMRVDWSQNLVTNYDLDFEAASVENIPFYVQEFDDATGERNRDAPLFEEDGSYFDITSRIFARAGQVEFPGYGMVPLCFLRGEETTECGAGEYSIRHSFARIDPEHQYVPLEYKGPETELFGFFWTDRLTYDAQTGIREQNRRRYLNRHNLWANWYDAEGNEIPVAERTLTPIVYHVNRDFPDDLREIVIEVGAQWNGIFSDAVREMGYPLAEGERAFVICPNNPVAEGDHPACGEAGTSPRIGDLRYSFMAYIPKYMEYGLLGLGPSNSDPETGEIISGAAYVYHHNNTAAHRTLEMVRLLNGDTDPTAFIDGVDLTDFVAQVNEGDGALRGHRHGLDEASYMVERLSSGEMSRYWAGERRAITEADMREQLEHGFDAWAEPLLQDVYDRGLLNGQASSADARLRALQDTEIEDMMLDAEVLMAAGVEPGMPALPEQIERASVLRGGMGRLAMDRARMLDEFAAERNMYLPEMADDALMGLARELRGVPAEEAYEIIRRSIYTAVWAHEVGHTVGLMHNFGGSDDAINYDPEYWELRSADGTVGPRLTDPMTEAERNGSIYNHAYSSVMDYAGRYTIDGDGVGRYDRAAILFGYAGLMEVFEDTGSMTSGELHNWFTGDGDVLFFNISGPQAMHYTQYWARMGDRLTDPANRRLVPVEAFEGEYAEVTVDGETFARVPYIYCSHSRSDLSDSCLTRDAGADPMERMTNILDDLDTWYILRNFPRGTVGVDTYNYASRYYPRVYGRLKHWHDLYGLYNALLTQFFDPATLQRFYTDPDTGWGPQTWAVQNAFNYLVQTLLMPDIGEYAGPVPQPDGTGLMENGYTPVSLALDVTDARYYSTSWGDGERDCGYQWYECLHHVGFYLDKIMAIEALTDTETNFVARATPVDVREWEVGYANTFGEQIAAINDAMMSQDWSAVGPYNANGRLAFPNYTGELNDPQFQPVNPSATFTIQLYWQVLGQARFPRNYDRSFVQESRLFELGTGDAPDVDPDRLETMLDPVTGVTYAALRIDGRQGAAESMIERGNQLLSWSTLCDDTGATATGADDCEDIPTEGFFASFYTRDAITREYRQYLQLMRVVANLAPMMDYGDPYNP